MDSPILPKAHNLNPIILSLHPCHSTVSEDLNTCYTRISSYHTGMLAIRLKPDLEERLNQLAKKTGRTKTYYAREAIEEHLADLEDAYLALDERALRELQKLGRPDQTRVMRYLEERISEDPRQFGKALRYEFSGLWCYRVGDVRLICQIQDEVLMVLVVRVGNRRDVYE